MRGSWANISKNKLILVAISILIFCAVWIGYGLFESANYEQQAKDKIGEYSEYTREKVTQACVGIAKTENIKCVAEAFEAKRNYEYNQSDLVAQRQSALWAYIMAGAAVFGIALSAVGVWLVKTTFDETRKANKIALKLGKSQTRAYVHIESANIGFLGKLLWVDVIFKNTGQSPASEVHAKLEPYVYINGLLEAGKADIRGGYDVAEVGKIGGGTIGSSGISTARGWAWSIAENSPENLVEAVRPSQYYQYSIFVLTQYVLEWLDVFGDKQVMIGSIVCSDFIAGEVLSGDGITGTATIQGETFDAIRWLERERENKTGVQV